jgi:ceramide glucosyltransferase
MKFMQTVLALLLMADRLWKHSAVVHFFQQRAPSVKRRARLVSVIQPVVSGDATLAASLERTLQMRSVSPYEVLWVVDDDDEEAKQLCARLSDAHPGATTRLLVTAPPGATQNPKLVKVIAGVAIARGDILCILDDDTRLPDGALDLSLPYLDLPNVGLAFGLPYYVSFGDFWSRLVSYFVNSNSLLTYVPYTGLTPPVTINGMFYVLRREVYDAVGGFGPIVNIAADDFAVALLLRRHGYALAQTPLLHAISTTVRDRGHYVRLMHRWFVSPRESLLRHLTRREQAMVYVVSAAPAVGQSLLALSLLVRPSKRIALLTAMCFVYSYATFAHFNRRYLRHAAPWRHSWMVPLIQLLFPIQALVALLSPQRINWRGRIMQVEHGGTFHYVQRHAAKSSR